jgi:hypothetical protein
MDFEEKDDSLSYQANGVGVDNLFKRQHREIGNVGEN